MGDIAPLGLLAMSTNIFECHNWDRVDRFSQYKYMMPNSIRICDQLSIFLNVSISHAILVILILKYYALFIWILN